MILLYIDYDVWRLYQLSICGQWPRANKFPYLQCPIITGRCQKPFILQGFDRRKLTYCRTKKNLAFDFVREIEEKLKIGKHVATNNVMKKKNLNKGSY